MLQSFLRAVKNIKNVTCLIKKITALSEEAKLQNLFIIEKKLKAYDSRISDVDAASYSESESQLELYNSFGLKLKESDNHFYYYASVVIKEGEEVKTGYKVALFNDPTRLILIYLLNKSPKMDYLN